MNDRDYVIIDSVSADLLSVPMTLAQCKYIRDREAEAADGAPVRLAIVRKGSELRRSQAQAAREMSGNPPRTRIVFDGPIEFVPRDPADD